jgi:hypothetical protein
LNEIGAPTPDRITLPFSSADKSTIRTGGVNCGAHADVSRVLAVLPLMAASSSTARAM